MTRLFKESKILIHFISLSHVNFSKLCCKLAETTILGRGYALFFPPDRKPSTKSILSPYLLRLTSLNPPEDNYVIPFVVYE